MEKPPASAGTGIDTPDFLFHFCCKEMFVNTKILIGISARHLHLSAEHLETLFGKGAALHVRKLIADTGQFAAEECVSLVTAKSRIDNVRVLGPLRGHTQVELSPTEARMLGITPPVRDSGDTQESAGLTIEGPKGSIPLHEGVIIPARHIHLPHERVKEMGLGGKSTVSVRIGGTVRSVIFEHVLLRPHSGTYSEMHIDTDEGNACMTQSGSYGDILVGTAR